LPANSFGIAGLEVAQRPDPLEFDDDLILDQEVGDKFANNHVLLKDHDSPLLHDTEPAFPHHVRKSVPIDRFNEPMTKRIGNPKSTPNDPFGHRLQRPRIPFIHLHPANPP
jgi:hypothetical protein